MSVLDAVQRVLADAGEPLHYKEITRRIVSEGLWQPGGQTPEATVAAQLSVEIRHRGDSSRFKRLRPGVFALTDGAAPTGGCPGRRRFS